MDKLKSASETAGSTASAAPTVFVDEGSVVTIREFKNMAVKSLNTKLETERDPENKPGRSVVLNPKVDISAQDGSVVCADVMSGIMADNVDLSISVKKSKVCAEQVDATHQPSSQGPAASFIVDHKVALISCLRADPSFILQHVHTQKIITDGQYLMIKNISAPEKAVIEIIDHVISRGQEICSLFLDLLKNSDILETYPEIKEIINLM